MENIFEMQMSSLSVSHQKGFFDLCKTESEELNPK
jgi:hypothetical protein